MHRKILVAALVGALAVGTSGLRAQGGSGTAQTGSGRRAPTPDLIRGLVEESFGPILGDEGVRVRRSMAGGFQVLMDVAPAADGAGRPRRWSRVESRRILGRMSELLSSTFPGTRIEASSGIDLEDPASGEARRETLDLLAVGPPRPITQAGRGRIILVGAPGDLEAGAAPPLGDPAATAGAFPAGPPPAPVAPVDPPAAPDTVLIGPAPLGAPAGFAPATGPGFAAPVPARPQGSINLSELEGVVSTPLPIPAPSATPPPAATTLPDPAGLPGRVATSNSYLFPRDNDQVEVLIEKQVEASLKQTFRDTRVKAHLVRPGVVRVAIEVAMTGHPRENVPVILHFVRDTTRTLFAQQFSNLRLHHQSRIRVTEADDRFSYDYRFHELTPVGVPDRGVPDPIFRPLRLERAALMDLPRAFPIGRDTSGFAFGTTFRRLSSGLYDNVSTSDAKSFWFDLRRGFFTNLEASFSYYSTTNTVVPTAPGLFTPSEGSLDAVALGMKYLLPYQLNGMSLAIGFKQAFQPGSERRFYLPDDFSRLYNVYVTASRRVYDHLLLHMAVKRTEISLAPDFEDSGIITGGMGLEYILDDRALLMLEVTNDRYDSDVAGPFGKFNEGDGVLVNAGAVFGTSIGDIEVSARKLNLDLQKEVTVGVAYRW